MPSKNRPILRFASTSRLGRGRVFSHVCRGSARRGFRKCPNDLNNDYPAAFSTRGRADSGNVHFRARGCACRRQVLSVSAKTRERRQRQRCVAGHALDTGLLAMRDTLAGERFAYSLLPSQRKNGPSRTFPALCCSCCCPATAVGHDFSVVTKTQLREAGKLVPYPSPARCKKKKRGKKK